ncbi:MAG: hypothetical protein ABIH74_01730, partial [Candidatus Omnitrophota bacterium]
MIERDPKYYVTGHEGKDPYDAPFYIRSLVFDGKEGDFNARLVDKFNIFLGKQAISKKYNLVWDEAPPKRTPSKIIVINASHDDLPTSYETARIFEDFCKEKGLSIPAKVINTRGELVDELRQAPAETLVVSQCVDKKVYDVALAEELKRQGVVIVPGEVTAPGSVFSDKDSTYRLLSDDGKDWDKVARYRKISVEGKGTPAVVDDIFTAIDELQ